MREELNLSVEIYDTVIKRISHAISQSDVEEGGKLLGYISSHRSKVILQVESYIDSGPNVSNSASHLHPNGSYQEAMFRVVESFHPKIEHLGSWHSHHCNSLNDLSEGDKQGYIRSVNNLHYNLDYFFVLLVTGISQTNIRCRYFIFRRGQNEYSELHESAIQIIHGSSTLEPILQQLELASFDSRSLANLRKQTPSTVHEMYQHNKSEDFLKTMRVEDNKWITREFPEVNTFQNNKDGTIFWQWPTPISHGKLYFRYYHPPSKITPSLARVRIEMVNQNTTLYSGEFPLNKHRFKSIKRFVKKIEKSIIKNNLGQRTILE